MKILTISADVKLISLVNSFVTKNNQHFAILNQSKNPLDLVGFVYEKNPSVVILDNDYVKPNAADIISTIKKMRNDIEIIFITSDPSVELGKEISPLGIAYYTIKPVDLNEFDELLNSISKNKIKTNY